MSKRKITKTYFYDPLENRKKQGVSPNAARSADTEKYAYAIMKENGGPYLDTEIQLEAIFTTLEEANKEAKAMSRDSDYWPGSSESGEDGSDAEEGVEESVGPNGEWSISMVGGEDDYEKLRVVARPSQFSSTHATEKRRKKAAKEWAKIERVAMDRARGEGVVEYV